MRLLSALALLLSFPSWAIDPSAPLDCGNLLPFLTASGGADAPISRSDPRFPVAQALREMRKPDGTPSPLTYSRFEKQISELVLYLVGKRTAEEMAKNRFFNSRSGKIDIERGVRGLFEEDAELVKAAVTAELKKKFELLAYRGESAETVAKKFSAAAEVVVVNHQIPGLQSTTATALLGSKALKSFPTSWLVGAESSAPLSPEALTRADLVRYSTGGEFDVPLTKAKTVYVAGGAIDQCLVQTIASVAKKSEQKAVVIRVLKPLSYVDLAGGTHTTLSEYLGQTPNPTERARMANEMTEMLKDDWDMAPKRPKFGEPFTLKDGTRTIRIEYVDTP